MGDKKQLTHRVEFLLGDVFLGTVLGEGAEGLLDLVSRLDVFCFSTDHEGHELLQGDVAVPVGVDDSQDGLELGIGLVLFDQLEVVTQCSEAGLELAVVEATRFVLVEVLEHHRELAQGLLTHAGDVACLDLLLEVVLHAHRQLIQLVPGLAQSHLHKN